jgi:hypothetical protein
VAYDPDYEPEHFGWKQLKALLGPTTRDTSYALLEKEIGLSSCYDKCMENSPAGYGDAQPHGTGDCQFYAYSQQKMACILLDSFDERMLGEFARNCAYVFTEAGIDATVAGTHNTIGDVANADHSSEFKGLMEGFYVYMLRDHAEHVLYNTTSAGSEEADMKSIDQCKCIDGHVPDQNDDLRCVTCSRTVAACANLEVVTAGMGVQCAKDVKTTITAANEAQRGRLLTALSDFASDPTLGCDFVRMYDAMNSRFEFADCDGKNVTLYFDAKDTMLKILSMLSNEQNAMLLQEITALVDSGGKPGKLAVQMQNMTAEGMDAQIMMMRTFEVEQKSLLVDALIGMSATDMRSTIGELEAITFEGKIGMLAVMAVQPAHYCSMLLRVIEDMNNRDMEAMCRIMHGLSVDGGGALLDIMHSLTLAQKGTLLGGMADVSTEFKGHWVWALSALDSGPNDAGPQTAGILDLLVWLDPEQKELLLELYTPENQNMLGNVDTVLGLSVQIIPHIGPDQRTLMLTILTELNAASKASLLQSIVALTPAGEEAILEVMSTSVDQHEMQLLLGLLGGFTVEQAELFVLTIAKLHLSAQGAFLDVSVTLSPTLRGGLLTVMEIITCNDACKSTTATHSMTPAPSPFAVDSAATAASKTHTAATSTVFTSDGATNVNTASDLGDEGQRLPDRRRRLVEESSSALLSADEAASSKIPAYLLSNSSLTSDHSTVTLVDGTVIREHCVNNRVDYDETDVDCGAECPKCGNGLLCAHHNDCESMVCKDSKCAPQEDKRVALVREQLVHVMGGMSSAEMSKFLAPLVTKTAAQIAEAISDVCKADDSCLHGDGAHCNAHQHCRSSKCKDNECMVSDGAPCAGRFMDIAQPSGDEICASEICELGRVPGDGNEEEGLCAPMSLQHCTDGFLNNNETDVDCGGGECEQCGTSKRCLVDFDCESDACSEAGYCMLGDGEACSSDAACSSKGCRAPGFLADGLTPKKATWLNKGICLKSDRRACAADAECSSENCGPDGTCLVSFGGLCSTPSVCSSGACGLHDTCLASDWQQCDADHDCASGNCGVGESSASNFDYGGVHSAFSVPAGQTYCLISNGESCDSHSICGSGMCALDPGVPNINTCLAGTLDDCTLDVECASGRCRLDANSTRGVCRGKGALEHCDRNAECSSAVCNRLGHECVSAMLVYTCTSVTINGPISGAYVDRFDHHFDAALNRAFDDCLIFWDCNGNGMQDNGESRCATVGAKCNVGLLASELRQCVPILATTMQLGRKCHVLEMRVAEAALERDGADSSGMPMDDGSSSLILQVSLVVNNTAAAVEDIKDVELPQPVVAKEEEEEEEEVADASVACMLCMHHSCDQIEEMEFEHVADFYDSQHVKMDFEHDVAFGYDPGKKCVADTIGACIFCDLGNSSDPAMCIFTEPEETIKHWEACDPLCQFQTCDGIEQTIATHFLDEYKLNLHELDKYVARFMKPLCSACGPDAACQTGGLNEAEEEKAVASVVSATVEEKFFNVDTSHLQDVDDDGSDMRGGGNKVVVAEERQKGASAAGEAWSLADALKSAWGDAPGAKADTDAAGAKAGASRGGRGGGAGSFLLGASAVLVVVGAVVSQVVQRRRKLAAGLVGEVDGGGAPVQQAHGRSILAPLHSGEGAGLVPAAASLAL